MFEISMTAFAATIFEPGSFEVSDKFSDFRRHAVMVPLQYHHVKAANATKSIGRITARFRVIEHPSVGFGPMQSAPIAALGARLIATAMGSSKIGAVRGVFVGEK
jgi:hypothetical protein